MSSYEGDHKTDENGVHWVRVDLVNRVMKADQAVMDQAVEHEKEKLVLKDEIGELEVLVDGASVIMARFSEEAKADDELIKQLTAKAQAWDDLEVLVKEAGYLSICEDFEIKSSLDFFTSSKTLFHGGNYDLKEAVSKALISIKGEG